MELVIRADASTEIGTGHVVRCLALAEEWIARGGRAHLASAQLPGLLRTTLEEAGVKCHHFDVPVGGPEDAERTRALAQSLDAAWVVQDGYQFDTVFQATLGAEERQLLVIDDYGGAGHYSADLILNQNLHADGGLYPNRESGTRLLLGARYALLRRQFSKWRDWVRETPARARRILLTLGGGDAVGTAAKVIDALAPLGSLEVEAVVAAGTANPRIHDIQAAAARATFPVRVDVRVSDMAALMAWAEVSISAGGTTCWELSFMGVPNCVVSLTEAQGAIARSLQERGVALDLGEAGHAVGVIAGALTSLVANETRRAEMSERGRGMIDGRGVERVVDVLQAGTVKLRPATMEDREFLWTLRNEDRVRAASFNTSPVAWPDHVNWFESAMSDPSCRIWITTDSDGTPTGQGRFRILGPEAEISVSVSPAWRGKGYGSMLIRALTDSTLRAYPEIQRVVALIKVSNETSRRAFERAGYALDRTLSVGDSSAWRYLRVRAE